MRKNVFSILFLLFIVFLPWGRYSVATQEEYAPNEVLVKFRKGIGRAVIQQAIEAVQGKIITYLGSEIATSEWDSDVATLRSFLGDSDLLHLKVPESLGSERATSRLRLNPNVEYAEKNMIIHIFLDPYYPLQWGVDTHG